MLCSVHNRMSCPGGSSQLPATDNYCGVFEMTVIQVLCSVSIVFFSLPQTQGTDSQARLTTPPALCLHNCSGDSLPPASAVPPQTCCAPAGRLSWSPAA